MKSELVQFEKEEAEKRLKPLNETNDDELSLVEAKPTTPAEKVLDVVRAVETLAHSGPTENSVPPKSPGGPNSELKTTTIVMSKHTLAPQQTTVSEFSVLCVHLCFAWKHESLVCFCVLLCCVLHNIENSAK